MRTNGERATSDVLSPQAQLARRLNLLLDVVVAERGKPVTFREVQAELETKAIKLSRARWFYMKEGTGRLVSDPVRLAWLCHICNVDPSYRTGHHPDLPERTDSPLGFVNSHAAPRANPSPRRRRNRRKMSNGCGCKWRRPSTAST